MRYIVSATCALVAAAGCIGALSASPSPAPDPVVAVESPAPTAPVAVPDVQVEAEPVEVEVIPAPEPVMEPEHVASGEVEVSVVIEPLPETDPEDYWDVPAFREPSTSVGSWWDGLLVGDVIVCPPGYEVSIDVTPAGTTWAACM